MNEFEYSKALQRLKDTSPTQRELDVAIWILNNTENVPIELNHFLKDFYCNNKLDVIRYKAQWELQMNPEELQSIITKDFVVLLFGNKF